jgi:hypothetical protein
MGVVRPGAVPWPTATFLDRRVAPCRSNQLGFCEHLTGRGQKRLQQLKALAANGHLPPLSQNHAPLHIKNERAKSERRGW